MNKSKDFVVNSDFLIGLLFSVLSAYFWYDKRKTDNDMVSYKSVMDAKLTTYSKDLAAVSRKQTEHDNKFVTDQRVRDIVKDEIKPIKDDVAQMKINVEKIMDSLNELATELKVNNALRDYDKAKK